MRNVITSGCGCPDDAVSTLSIDGNEFSINDNAVSIDDIADRRLRGPVILPKVFLSKLELDIFDCEAKGQLSLLHSRHSFLSGNSSAMGKVGVVRFEFCILYSVFCQLLKFERMWVFWQPITRT